MAVKHESMYHGRTEVPQRGLALSAFLACAVLLGSTTVGLGFDTAKVISANVSPTPAYLGNPVNQWNIPQADLSNGFVIPFDGVGLYSIAPSFGGAQGALQWTGSNLDQDLTAGGRAHGTFLSGGLFRISGRLYNGAALIHDGLLFEGTVGAFEIWEAETNLNRIELIGQPLVTPTVNPGAYMNANGLLNGPYILSFQGVQAQQMGGDLVGLTGDINTVAALQFSLVSIVPEPATALLVTATLGFGVARRKRR